jgi:hypothetical protein
VCRLRDSGLLGARCLDLALRRRRRASFSTIFADAPEVDGHQNRADKRQANHV